MNMNGAIMNIKTIKSDKFKYIDLSYLNHCTRSNSELMMEMIQLYLEQTPPLISKLKQSLQDKDWDSLQTAAHKMIPSFLIMGIGKDFETMARKIQEYSRTEQHLDELPEFVLQLDKVCSQACGELKEEYNLFRKTT